MSKEYANTDFPENSFSETDARLDFECRQAFLRKEHAAPDIDEAWTRFRDTSGDVAEPPTPPVPLKRQRKRYFLVGALAGVAAVLLAITIWRGYDAYLQQAPVTIFVAEERSHDITIDAENGEQLIVATHSLNDPHSGALIENGKADFKRVRENVSQMRTIRTPYGKDYRVELNDGTEVIMNADSKLSFPTRFTGKERVVTLEGEAYFKVAKNPKRPFIVKTERMDTKALGTEFNVRAYKGTEPHVTLIEGVVVVNVPEVNKNVRMVPNEDVSLAENALTIKTVDPQYYIQWKDGFFYYDNVALSEILSDIGRWYNINIEIEKPALMSYHLHFVVNRDAKIEDVVDNLNDFSYLTVVKNGNKLSIRGKKSKSRD